jgi:hypothetical protein
MNFTVIECAEELDSYIEGVPPDDAWPIEVDGQELDLEYDYQSRVINVTLRVGGERFAEDAVPLTDAHTRGEISRRKKRAVRNLLEKYQEEQNATT